MNFLLVFSIRERYSNSSRYLFISVFSISAILLLLHIFVTLKNDTVTLIVFLFGLPLIFAIYPILNSYINSLINSVEKIKIDIKSFAVPILIFLSLIILLLFLDSKDFTTLVLLFNSFDLELDSNLVYYIWFAFILYYLQAIYFLIKFFRNYQKLKNDKKRLYIAEWIKFVIYAIVIFEVPFSIALYYAEDILLIDSIMSNFAIVFFGIIGLKHDEILYKLQLSKILNGSNLMGSERKIKSKLEFENQKEIVNQIKKIIVNEKLYLNPHLKISNFAKRLHLPEKELSIIINDVLGKNFSSFLNEYKIKEACTLLKNNDMKISDIPAKAGFFSRSAFNSTFKELTGTTPTEYRSAN